MTIQWSDPIPYDGSGECPEAARDVPCMIADSDGIWLGDHGLAPGRAWDWDDVTEYRVPVTAPSMADELAEALESTLSMLGEFVKDETPAITRARALLAKAHRGMKE